MGHYSGLGSVMTTQIPDLSPVYLTVLSLRLIQAFSCGVNRLNVDHTARSSGCQSQALPESELTLTYFKAHLDKDYSDSRSGPVHMGF